MGADKARRLAFWIVCLRISGKHNLQSWISDAQFDRLRSNGRRRLFVATQHVRGCLFQVVVDGEFNMERASAPVSDRSAVWPDSVVEPLAPWSWSCSSVAALAAASDGSDVELEVLQPARKAVTHNVVMKLNFFMIQSFKWR